MMRRKLKFLAIFISILILALLVVYADPVKFTSIVAKSDYKLLLVAWIVSTISLFIRVIKWKVLIGNVKFSDIIPVQLLGMTISNFSPGKLGEPVKAVILKLKNGMPVSQTLPSIIWERILDVIVLIMLSALGAYSFIRFGREIYLISMAALFIFTAILVIAFLVLYKRRFAGRIFGILKKFPIANRISENFIKTFQETKIGRKRILYSFIFTVIPWILEGFIMYYAFLSIGINLSPIILASMFALATLIGVASSLPGGIGSTDVVLTIFLASFGIDKSIAITGILLSRFLSIWYLNLLGGFSFIYLTRKLNISMRSILR